MKLSPIRIDAPENLTEAEEASLTRILDGTGVSVPPACKSDNLAGGVAAHGDLLVKEIDTLIAELMMAKRKKDVEEEDDLDDEDEEEDDLDEEEDEDDDFDDEEDEEDEFEEEFEDDDLEDDDDDIFYDDDDDE